MQLFHFVYIEDDTIIPTDVKVPILIDFHKHIYDRDWHFSCGTERYRPLMDQFHHVSIAFLELDKGYQEVIEDVTKMMGAGMAKFINKEIESIDDYDEYCHYVAGLVMLSASKLFHASGLEDLAPSHISNSVGVFIQKADVVQDYLEDINEIPKPLVFWPRQIWSKYVDKLEDFKYEENSEKAVQCLNEMITNALVHAEDCLRYLSVMRDHTILRWCAIPQILAMGILALCYNNIQVFRSTIKLRRGFVARIFDSTSTMADIYGAFFDFSCMLIDKIDKNDPHAHKTLSRIEGIQKICRDSGTLKKGKFYSPRSEPQYCQQILPVNFLHHLSMFAGKFSMQMVVVFIVVAVLVGCLYTNGP